MDLEGQFMLVPVKLLERMMIKRNNAAVGQWLIYWAHLPAEGAIWELVDEIMAKQLHPWGHGWSECDILNQFLILVCSNAVSFKAVIGDLEIQIAFYPFWTEEG